MVTERKGRKGGTASCGDELEGLWENLLDLKPQSLPKMLPFAVFYIAISVGLQRVTVWMMVTPFFYSGSCSVKEEESCGK